MSFRAPVMLLFVSLLSSAVVQAQAAQPVCEGVAKTEIDRASDLPKGALDAFGAPMAEKGQPFQATDKIEQPPRPLYRFKHAEQNGCTLRIEYEHSGRDKVMEVATLVGDETGWKLIGRKLNRLP